MAASVGKSCPPLQARCGSVSRLMVTPRVSGLERSQEKSLEQHFPETVCPSTSSASFSRLPSPGAAAGPLARPSPNGNSSRHNGNDTTLSKPKPFLTLPGRSHSIYNINNRFRSLHLSCSLCAFVESRCGLHAIVSFLFSRRSNTPVKPPSSASAVATSTSSMRPPTPSTRVQATSGPLRPPSRANSGALFTSSPGLPPPPPLLQGPTHSAAAGTVNRNFHCCGVSRFGSLRLAITPLRPLTTRSAKPTGLYLEVKSGSLLTKSYPVVVVMLVTWNWRVHSYLTTMPVLL